VLNQEKVTPEKMLSVLKRIIFSDFWKMKDNLAKINITDDGTALAEAIYNG